ncbi:hypothetical protein H310_13360 [Aphanomyces invadans]|uniref:Uncharacterized protein n=1 Tax=Aphanomyces invadans TaxID=157072 RepID=A0A024TDS6_9STRA|nr:hypothetical protein H310_13360 [Aphanomyces invadans]ETV92305.1 hypothetical protein H310_13360 [Aphanomyces invadans]|eukprot:XP_008879056.1 hypothetical protein H310_13360 [Aphanomyces invadans]
MSSTVEKTGVVRPFGIKTGKSSDLAARNAALTPRRFKKFSLSETWLPLKKSSPAFDCLFPENHSSDVKKIKYATYPYHYWGLALILAIGASIFVYALCSTSNFRIKKGFWWQYMIIVVLYMFAAISFFLPRVEVFRMNHTYITVCRPKTYQYLLCLTRALEFERKLTDVRSIMVEESGEKMGEIDTRLYTIRFEFSDGVVETLLEHYSKRVAIRRCRSLNFLLAAYTPASPIKPRTPKAAATAKIELEVPPPVVT